MDYKSSGVDIAAGNELVSRIKPFAKRTARPEVLGGIGGFGALFELDTSRYERPVLVSATDGVGTKLKLAMAYKQHRTVGIDLVAMCANDLITLGAEPLFFLDYYATGLLSVDTATDVVAGIAEGCEQAGAALVGGETAEMPGMYSGQDYDLAGFCVGAVEKSAIIDGKQCTAGDTLIALPSSGPHANGFSLIRKILDQHQLKLTTPFKDTEKTLGDVLLEPTTIYVKTILSLLTTTSVKAIAHITGGGLLENLPRVVPEHLKCVIHQDSWQWPDIFKWLQIQGNIAFLEMVRTFNCGAGMVLCVNAADAHSALQTLSELGTQPWVIGELTERAPSEQAVVFT